MTFGWLHATFSVGAVQKLAFCKMNNLSRLHKCVSKNISKVPELAAVSIDIIFQKVSKSKRHVIKPILG